MRIIWLSRHFGFYALNQFCLQRIVVVHYFCCLIFLLLLQEMGTIKSILFRWDHYFGGIYSNLWTPHRNFWSTIIRNIKSPYHIKWSKVYIKLYLNCMILSCPVLYFIYIHIPFKNFALVRCSNEFKHISCLYSHCGAVLWVILHSIYCRVI